MWRRAGATLVVTAWLAGASHAVAQADSVDRADSVRTTAVVQAELDAQAQADVLRRPPLMPIDRIVAVVGKQAIMQSQLDEQFYQLLGGLPPAAVPRTAADSARIRSQVLSDLVDDELLVQEAARDTAIKVTDKEVIDAVDAAVKNIRARYTTEIEFTTQLHQAGFVTLDEYRRFLSEQSRRDMQKERLKQTLKEKGGLKPVQPSEQEMKAFYEQQQGQFGSRPATVTFRQVVVAPRPTDAAKARALALADSILVELRKGADFAVAAKRFSADPGSRDRGGDLGWARRGVFVPEFDRVAFALKIGVISEPVETPFGYHLIQVMRTQPGEVQVRHILIAAEVSQADVDSAAAHAQQVYQAALAGAPFDSLQRQWHDDTEEREAAAVPLEKLPEVYKRGIIGADSTARVLPPFALESPGGGRKYAIVMVTERRAEGEVTYQDVRDRVKQILSEDLAIQRYVAQLRRATFVEVKGS
jgi:peptidyl-prolyl cis-trans isomerase SurA